MRILLVMKPDCEFNGLGLFAGSVADCKHKVYEGVVCIIEKNGKNSRVPDDQVLFLGTVFRGIEIPVINNLEEAEAGAKSDVQEDDNNLDEEAKDGVAA